MIITVYDYENTPDEIEIPAQTYEDIRCIEVRVLSGDETGKIFMKNGDFIPFDSSNTRICGFYDGEYVVVGAETIKKWNEYKPKKNGLTISYARMSDVYEWFYEEKEENNGK